MLMKGYTNICGDNKIYWESKYHEWLAQQPVIQYGIIKHTRSNKGNNGFLRIGGTPHVGIRKYFYITEKKLAWKDGINMPACPPATAEAAL